MLTYPETMSKTINTEYAIVRLTRDNIKDLAKLYLEVYDSRIGEEYFIKKYNTAYTGVENVGFLAYSKSNQPIAYYGVIPCFIKCEKEIVLAAQSADTMTHPKHRYKGMFMELSEKTFDLCKELSIRLVFGFPNQNSYYGAITKLGWKETEKMDCFTIPVNALPLKSISQKLKLKKLYNQYSEFILKRKLIPSNGVANSVLHDGFAGVYRSDEYLSHKTYSGARVIQIDNSRVWINNRNNLLIGDMEGVIEKNFSRVISKLKAIAWQLGLKQLQFHCSQETGLHKLFKSSFKSSKSFPVLFQDFGSSIPLEKIKFTFADIDIF